MKERKKFWLASIIILLLLLCLTIFGEWRLPNVNYKLFRGYSNTNKDNIISMLFLKTLLIFVPIFFIFYQNHSHKHNYLINVSNN
jgi:hypothetical protein